MKRVAYDAGQSLIELLVIVGIVVLTTTALIAATTASLRSTSSDKTRSIAVKYAQEGIEFIRAERDKSWDDLVAKAQENSGEYCLGTADVLVPPPCNTPNIGEGSLIRSVILTWVPSPTPPSIVPYMTVLARIAWGDESRSNPIEITTRLTQWK